MFCGAENKLTEEHVFPAFMGGELIVPNGSCCTCNGGFSADEAKIKSSTEILLNLLGIENRYGIVPSVEIPVEIHGMDMEGLIAYRRGDGEMILRDVVRSSTTPDGKKTQHGFFVTKKGADKFTTKGLARGAKLIEREVPAKIVVEGNPKMTISFAFSVETRRVVAKIALASIAYELGLPFAESPHFNKLRQVGSAQVAKAMPVWSFADEMFMRLHTRTAHQHSVICYLSGGMHKGWALVTLFGGLSYLVEVSPDYSESKSRSFSIFYDAVSKERINPVVLADEQKVIGHLLNRETKFENQKATYEQWFPLFAAFCAEKGYEVSKCEEADSKII
jgi:hypothetical protein